MAEKIADQIQKWHKVGTVGMRLIRQEHPYGLHDFTDWGVPVLQDRGIFRTGYETHILRGSLKIPNSPFKKVN